MDHEPGSIEVICGSMFSGKSEELIRRLRRASIARQQVQAFKPEIDDRYSPDDIVSHDARKIECTKVKTARDILSCVRPNTKVVGIDEAQFLGDGLIEVCETLANQGKRVVVAGLDQDYRGNPFEPIPQLLALAESITKGEDSELKKGFLITRWVYRNLAKNLGGPPEASALQALAARAGDCSEHAALFAALARAAGLPARTAWGLVASEGALRFHVWSEFHAGGSWVPVDAALGRFGLPACYLTLGYDRDEAGVRLFKLYAASRGKVLKAEEGPEPAKSGK